METKYYGVSLTYQGKRYIWGNNSDHFGDMTLKMAKSNAKHLNTIIRKKESVFKKPINARPVLIEHGKTYPIVERGRGDTLIITKRKHAG